MAFKPPAPTPPGLWRRVPPAIFPSIMGLFGLGLAWRRGVAAFGLPAGIAETILGAVTLLFLFALVAYSAKFLRRPAVLVEELRILPGRAGVAAMLLTGVQLGLLADAASPELPAPPARQVPSTHSAPVQQSSDVAHALEGTSAVHAHRPAREAQARSATRREGVMAGHTRQCLVG